MRKLGPSTRILALVALAGAVTAVAVGAAGASTSRHTGTTITGAGSTFVSPLVAQWISPLGSAYGYELQYSAVGSGAGITSITARTVDFGASDAPLTSDQFSACNGCLQIPWALGGTAVMYNLPGVKNLLHMDGPTLANIFMGKITTWNDPAIAKLNPGVSLPSTKISIAHRSDNSGTTFNFTDYLSSVSPAWNSQIGRGVAVNWPVGSGGKGSAGVAALVTQTPGSIGYADVFFAIHNHLSYFAMKNRSGKFATPGIRGILAAASSDQKPDADQRALDREPAREVRERLSDLDLHLRDRRAAVEQGAGPEEVPLLGRDEGPGLRTEAAVRADPEERARRRREDDREDPLVRT